MRRTSKRISAAEGIEGESSRYGMRDMFNMLYNGHEKSDCTLDIDDIQHTDTATAREAWDSVLGAIRSSSDYDSLLKECMGNTFSSSVATLKLIDAAKSAYAAQHHAIRERQEREKQSQDGSGGDDQGTPNGQSDDQPTPIEQQAQKALERVSEVVTSAKDGAETCNAIGRVAGVGLEENIDSCDDDAMKFVDNIINSPEFKRVIDLVGRMESVFSSGNEKGKGNVEPCGVAPTGDILNLLPQELIALRSSNSLEQIEAVQRLMENCAQGYDRFSVTEKKRGPVCIALDNSGSMDDGAFGGPTRWQVAKAVAIATISECNKYGREWKIVIFQSGIVKVLSEKKNGYYESVKYLLRMRTGGGTNIQNAMVQTAQSASRMGNGADILVITDAEDKVYDSSEIEHNMSLSGSELYYVQVGSFSGDSECSAYNVLSSMAKSETLISDLSEQGVEQAFSVAADMFKSGAA